MKTPTPVQPAQHTRTAWSLVLAGTCLLHVLPARAQLWNPLDTKAKPNMLIAFDTSVTMGINKDCTGCHAPTRLDLAKVDIRNTLPLFQDLFAYGGYRYAACGYAHIVDYPGNTPGVDDRCYPDPSDLAASYACVDNMIASAGHCGQAEQALPGNVLPNYCITPGCTNDLNVLIALSTPGILPGYNPQPAPVAGSTTCKAGAPQPTVDIALEFLNELGPVQWPRFYVAINGADIQTQLCDPIWNAFNATWAKVQACLNAPDALWPGMAAWLAAGQGNFCNPGQIALNVCTAGTSPLLNTCVCNNALPGCTPGNVDTECGVPMLFKARQQVAVCESYNPSTFQAHYKAQPDNRVNPGGCRENVALFFTDGWYGFSPGINAEVAVADVEGPYTPLSDASERNRFVFHVSNQFESMADIMQSTLTNGKAMVRYNALDQSEMIESFSTVVNRVFRGTYSGSNLSFDRYHQRVALHLFTVPAGPGPTGERYLGRPARIAWHEVDPNTGAITPAPIFETDWASKAGPPLVGTFGGTDSAYLGPGGTFRNGVARVQNVPANSVDRTGDHLADTHPTLTWGYMAGAPSTQPVIVDAPVEIPSGASAAAFASFLNTPAVRNRPRVIYALSNGYLHAIKGGVRRDNPPVTAGKVQVGFDYIEDADAGRELWRYKPPYVGWLDTLRVKGRATYIENDVVEQPVMNGQIVVREMRVANSNAASDFQTLLVFSQGQNGRGYAILDVTNPMAGPVVRRLFTLSGVADRASTEPMFYDFPNGVTGQTKAVVVVTGGLGGTPTLQRYDVIGAGAESFALPAGAGESYPTEPACLDVSGKGRVTHCYVLSSIGRLVRVSVSAAGAFSAAVDITPTTPFSVIGGGRLFNTRPVVFFGNDNAINIAFGSGDVSNLVAATGAQDAFFKVRDASFVQAVPPARATFAGVCGPDGSGNKDGVIWFAAGERVVSPPVVSRGVVAFTTYTPGADACAAGAGQLYAFSFERCSDAFDPAQRRPAAEPIGSGIPTSPVLLRAAERIVTLTSGSPTAPQPSANRVLTKGGQLYPLKRLYWRPQVNTR